METSKKVMNVGGLYLQGDTTVTPCFRCNGFNHSKVKCPRSIVCPCYNCGIVGDVARDCMKPRDEKLCFGCKETGHVKRQCPNGPGVPREGVKPNGRAINS